MVRGILTAVASLVAECGLSGAQASVVGTRTQLPHSVWDLPSVCVCVCAQLCPTLCSPMDCSMPGSFVHWISRKNTRVGCHFLLQGIFLIQGSNPHLLHWQANSLPLSHQGSQFGFIQFKNTTQDETELNIPLMKGEKQTQKPEDQQKRAKSQRKVTEE